MKNKNIIVVDKNEIEKMIIDGKEYLKDENETELEFARRVDKELILKGNNLKNALAPENVETISLEKYNKKRDAIISEPITTEELENSIENSKNQAKYALKLESGLFAKPQELSEKECKSIGRILVAEFVTDLNEEDVWILVEINSKFKWDSSYEVANIYEVQREFKKTRDALINAIFSNSESKNKKLKKVLFNDIDIMSERDMNGVSEGHKVSLNVKSTEKLEQMKNSRNYTKKGIKEELKSIHNSRIEEVKMYADILSKPFLENLSKEQQEYFKIETQEELEKIQRYGNKPKGWSTCVDISKELKESEKVISPKLTWFESGNMWNLIYGIITKNTIESVNWQYIYEYTSLKRLILEKLMESGIITKEREQYCKKFYINNMSPITLRDLIGTMEISNNDITLYAYYQKTSDNKSKTRD